MKTLSTFALTSILTVLAAQSLTAQDLNDRSNNALLQDARATLSAGAATFGTSSELSDMQIPMPTAQATTKFAIPAPHCPAPGNLPNDFVLPEPMSYTGTIYTIWHAVAGQLADSGLIPWKDVPSFEEISKRALAAASSTAFPPRRAGQPSLFTVPGFISEFEAATGAKFISGNSAKFLIDGTESFKTKDWLMKTAKKNLLVSTWGFYDDITGYETARLLIQKKLSGVEVKVILDDKVVYSHGKKVIKMMKDAGVEIIRYDEGRLNDYWHVKMIIADDKYAVVGGMNFGDAYSHKDPDGFKWRDTDMLYSGPAVLEAKRIFAQIWNTKRKENSDKLTAVDMLKGADNNRYGQARISIMLQDPPENSPILINMVKAMYGATKTINIENAYFVAIPAISQAVIDALARGVKVNILTNSAESIDPEARSIVDAINKCLIPIVRAGAGVYFKQGDTLHSKFMTVDGEFATIGSYNLHPRSERYDTEVNVALLDKAAVAELDATFKKDISIAKKIRTYTELEGKPGWFSQIMTTHFYGHLAPSLGK